MAVAETGTTTDIPDVEEEGVEEVDEVVHETMFTFEAFEMVRDSNSIPITTSLDGASCGGSNPLV